MALFGSKSGNRDDEGEYSPVSEEEHKPLRLDSDGEEAQPAGLQHHEIYALSRSLRRTNLFLKIIIGLLCITIIALLSMNIPDKVKDMIKHVTCNVSDNLIKSPVPPLPVTKVMFEKHPIYGQRPNQVSDAAWDALLPEGRGFVYVRDWEKYDMPPGQNTSWGMIYSVALFHQMHCLGQIRRFSYMFLDAIEKNDSTKLKEIKHMFIDMDHADHMLHCFDYLRQTISCAGDMAMEWPRTEPNGERFAVDGWGIPHECKDWSMITDYMDKNHFEHSLVSEIAPLIGASGKKK